MPPPVHLAISIDTEEDNWRPTRRDVTVNNVRELPRLHRFLRELHLRPTYFVTYPVASTPWAADILRQIHDDGGAEIAAHVHPWNTPPLDEELLPRHTMLKNLPPRLQLAKIVTVRDTLEKAVGVRPSSFRAGRLGLGPATVGALIRAGFSADSSVMPFSHWKEDEGADFGGAPVECYRLDGLGDVRTPVAGGPLSEVPLSCGFTRRPFKVYARVHRILRSSPLRPLRLAGIASRLGLVRRVIGSPETNSLGDLLALTRCLMREPAPFVHLTWHSPSLVPGLGPFVSTTEQREDLYRTVAAYVKILAAMAAIRPVTVGEAAATEGLSRAPSAPRDTVITRRSSRSIPRA